MSVKDVIITENKKQFNYKIPFYRFESKYFSSYTQMRLSLLTYLAVRNETETIKTLK